MATTDAVQGSSDTNLTTLGVAASSDPARMRIAQSTDAPILPLSDVKEKDVEDAPFDIEHVMVHDDPRKWSPFRKVIALPVHPHTTRTYVFAEPILVHYCQRLVYSRLSCKYI